MAIYEYMNDAGQIKEINMPMAAEHPEEILIFADGYYQPANDPIKGDRAAEIRKMKPEERIYRRRYGVGVSSLNLIPDYACKPGKDGLPVSAASCRRRGGEVVKRGKHWIREHKDGVHTNLAGQPIIDSNRAARENAARTGMELD